MEIKNVKYKKQYDENMKVLAFVLILMDNHGLYR